MRKPHIIIKRDRRDDSRPLGVKHAQKAIGEQQTPLVMDLSLRENVIAYCEVQFVGVEIVQESGRIDVVEPQVDAGSDLAQACEERRHDEDFHAVWQTEPESSYRRCWIECSIRRYECSNVSERCPYGFDQRHRPGGETQSFRPPC